MKAIFLCALAIVAGSFANRANAQLWVTALPTSPPAGSFGPGIDPPSPAGLHVCADQDWLLVGTRATTIVTFTITAEGTVENEAVARPSGTSLDEAALHCVAGWIYTPATKNGQPIPVHAAVGIAWIDKLFGEEPLKGANEVGMIVKVPQNEGAQVDYPIIGKSPLRIIKLPVRNYGLQQCERWHKDASRGVLVAFQVTPDRKVENAGVLATSGDTAEDADAVQCVSNRLYYNPATLDGKTVAVRLTAMLFGPSPDFVP